jgi:transcriptional regulator with XRE-family HTH domain
MTEQNDSTGTPISFGQYLRAYRKARDLTREELAKLVSYSPESIRKIESNQQRPSKYLAERLAEKLALSPEEATVFIRMARGLPAEPTIPTPLPVSHKLPLQLTSFIGHEKEIAEIKRLLSEVRLVTKMVTIAITVALAVLALAAGIFFRARLSEEKAAANAPLNAQPAPQEVAALMLTSHTKWRSLVAQVLTLGNPGGVLISSNITIQSSGKIRVTKGPLDKPTSEWISDNTTFWEIDNSHHVYTQNAVPEAVRSFDTYNPPTPPGDGENFVVPHPLEGFIPLGLGGYIFPHGLAQSLMQWESSVEGTDVIAGRETVIILSQVIEEGVVLKKHKYWIDSQTGLVLQSESYAQADLDHWAEQTTFTSIKYDAPIAVQTFTFQPTSDMKRVITLP